MPTYTYVHTGDRGDSCGERFILEQSIRDDALTHCPTCGCPVGRELGLPIISTPPTESKLRNLGMSKLVKRDKGVYENVSAQPNEKTIITEADLGGKAPGA
jgi:hypothetical protein